VEFLRRFLQHVLPDGFHKIRHTGLYASTRALDACAIARAQLRVRSEAQAVALPPSWQERLRQLTGVDVLHCPRCGARLEHRPVPSPTCLPRAPPERTAA